MAKDDYCCIVYQILSYMYQCLKSGEPVDPEMLTAEALFNINEGYRNNILCDLIEEGFIRGLSIAEKRYIDGTKYYDIKGFEDCRITAKGIEYLTDNSFIQKAKRFFADIKSITPFI